MFDDKQHLLNTIKIGDLWTEQRGKVPSTILDVLREIHNNVELANNRDSLLSLTS